jgi:hypothetical protein
LAIEDNSRVISEWHTEQPFDCHTTTRVNYDAKIAGPQHPATSHDAEADAALSISCSCFAAAFITFAAAISSSHRVLHTAAATARSFSSTWPAAASDDVFSTANSIQQSSATTTTTVLLKLKN